MARTQLRKLKIKHFRALQNVEIELGHHITVVCGKNGTSKSSILGIAAQIFSFEKDYVKDEKISFTQIAGGSFKSQYSEHFRLSKKFDVPGSMKVNIELFDGYTDVNATGYLELMKRERGPRPVVRDNSTAPEQSSRNFTHPVIFLSLKRLYPIADRNYKKKHFAYLNAHKDDFIGLTNELLNRSSSLATGTAGTISSAVSHGDNYDQESVSAGEDNAGQIIMALMSFRKLKEEYTDYKGGLLLIDEADAGLFPTAQINLFKILDRECRKLNLQVIMTSHSPTLIEYAFEQSQRNRGCRTIFLSNSTGAVAVKHDWSWAQISANINTRTFPTATGVSLPKVSVYFEDREAADLFAALMSRQPIKKCTKPVLDLSLGCSHYVDLVKRGVNEFSKKGIVCLDADADHLIRNKGFKTIILLPGALPPDQLIFEFLYNLPEDHDYWENNGIGFMRDVFTQAASEVRRELSITGSTVNLSERIAAYQQKSDGSKKLREIFKKFYKDPEIQKVVTNHTKPHSAWKLWVEENADSCNEFLSKFKDAMHGVLKNGHEIPVTKLTALKVNLKAE